MCNKKLLLTCKAPCPRCRNEIERPINCPEILCYQCQGYDLTARRFMQASRHMSAEDCTEAASDKQQFHTGAVRDTEDGKVQLDLLPFPELERIARHLEKGAVKYGRHNFLKGIPSSRCFRSMLRHVSAVAQGKTDEDHLSAIVFACFCLMCNQRLHQDSAEINDLRTYDPASDGDYGV